jgi:hypothetical protein
MFASSGLWNVVQQTTCRPRRHMHTPVVLEGERGLALAVAGS